MSKDSPELQEKDIYRDVSRYYANKFREHGANARGVDWNSQESQELRFQQFLRLIEHFQGRERFSLNDFGCGYGALATYLKQRGLSFRYSGYDIAEELITSARATWQGEAGVTFSSELTELELADYTVASGIFNVRLGFSSEIWEQYVYRTIGVLAAVSAKGFAFNALTSYSDPEHKRSDLFYLDPCQLFDYCKRTYSRNVTLLHDYGLYEFTIFVRL